VDVHSGFRDSRDLPGVVTVKEGSLGPFSFLQRNHMLPSQLPGSPSEKTRHEVGPSQPNHMTDTFSLTASDVEFVSPKELARQLRVSIDCVYRLAARRVLPAYRVLRRILFRRTDVSRWIESHRTDPRDPHLWQ